MIENYPPRHGHNFRNVVFGYALATIGTCVSGCNRGPARIYPPEIDAAKAAVAALEQLDSDGDQLLSIDELAACPAIRDAVERYDKNGDKQISGDEIAKRLGELSRGGLTGMYSLMFRVLVDGAPLPGAKVELIPEDFLGGAVQPARGVSSQRGLVRPATEGAAAENDGRRLPGVQPGIFRIAITGPTDEITERYGSGEELGLEVSESCLGTNIVFELETR